MDDEKKPVGECDWRACWYGSDPNRGSNLWTVGKYGIGHGELFAYLGPDLHETAGVIAQEHNAGLAAMRDRKDNAYRERNKVVRLLASLFPSGIKKTDIPDWNPEWHWCVYIDLPTGQVSWHIHESELEQFLDLSNFEGEWDGHDTPAKYERVAALARNTATPGRAMRDILGERARQLNDEGWTAEHDDEEHQNLELAKAAAAYLGHACNKDATRRSKTFPPGIWPWHRGWWKPADRRRDLVKAAALIIAQIEQLDREAARAGQ